VKRIYSRLLLENKEQWVKLHSLLSKLPAHDQRNFLYVLLRVIGKQHFSPDKERAGESWWREDVDIVSGAAVLLHGVIGRSVPLKENLVSWLTSTWGGGVGEPVGIRRAAIAALSQDEGTFACCF
jgi:telomere length regulation protein